MGLNKMIVNTHTWNKESHKSGVALRFPRVKRWRQDKPVSVANTYEDLVGMLEAYGS